MGGYGSGRRFGSARTHVEACRSLDVRWLHKKGCLRPALFMSLTWSNAQTGEQTASITLRTKDNMVVLFYRNYRDGEEWQHIEEPVEITWTRCAFGGKRVWFVCPGMVNGVACRRRVAVLYGAARYFACRQCYGLAYGSQSEGPADRALRRAQKIRMRLGGSGSLSDMFPWKPKHMRWATYERLRSEAEQAELKWLAKLDAWLDTFRR